MSQSLMMLLQPWLAVSAQNERMVSRLVLDSREVTQGALFVALQGHSVNAQAFIKPAIEAGAIAVLHQTPVSDDIASHAQSLNIPLFYLPQLVSCLSALASRFYGEPSQRLSVTGVTGTDGKTSVSQFLAQALAHLAPASERPPVVMGTLGNGAIHALSATNNTTPDAIAVQANLADWVQQGVRQAVMEVSSHGLVQGRVDAVNFDVAILTNLARDHMDYHKSATAYAAAKQRLFDELNPRALVINGDDDFGCVLVQRIQHANKLVFGFSEDLPVEAAQRLQGRHLRCTPNGLQFDVCLSDVASGKQSASVSVPLLGAFNASNTLAVMGALIVKGFSFEQAVQAVQALTPVRGRMEVVSHKPLTVVDYAHTPQALTAALNAVKAHQSNKNSQLMCVFGCGGDRDKGKRALMGKAAQSASAHVILTSDNPRSESPAEIVKDIEQGMGGAPYTVELNRAQAIQQAVSQLHGDDVLLVAGKGHETTQIIGKDVFEFDDVAHVRAAVQQCLEAP